MKKRYFKTKDEFEVTFEHTDEKAKKVALVSEINGWQPVKMSKRKADGVFYTKLRMPANRQYQYRFLVDGERWTNDQQADSYAQNEFGEQNSVVVLNSGS